AVDLIGEPLEEPRRVDRRATLGDLDKCLSGEGLDGSEHVRRALPRVLVVDALGRARSCGDRLAHVTNQLLAGLVEADDGSRRVVLALVNFEHVFHRAHERRILFGWDAEAFYAPGLEFVFFSARCTELVLTDSNTSSSTRRSPSSESVHRARPAGG